jgi:hypothetical protein
MGLNRLDIFDSEYRKIFPGVNRRGADHSLLSRDNNEWSIAFLKGRIIEASRPPYPRILVTETSIEKEAIVAHKETEN